MNRKNTGFPALLLYSPAPTVPNLSTADGLLQPNLFLDRIIASYTVAMERPVRVYDLLWIGPGEELSAGMINLIHFCAFVYGYKEQNHKSLSKIQNCRQNKEYGGLALVSCPGIFIEYNPLPHPKAVSFIHSLRMRFSTHLTWT